MGRQWNQIIESLGPLTGGTVSINANLGDIDALLTTLQADVADGIDISNISTLPDAGSNPVVRAFAFGYDYGNDIPVAVAIDGTSLSVSVTNGTINQSQSTTGGTGPTTFTSITYGTISIANASRKGLSIYNEGSGNLHITLGTSTTSTSSYTVKLLSGDYYEVPFNYTGLVGGIFATAGTARITSIS